LSKVIDVWPFDHGHLSVTLASGVRGKLDMKPSMWPAVFRELEEEAYFRHVGLFFDGIGWPNGQDLGPDTIVAEMQVIEDAAA
jgi:hypothetical protein